MYNTIEDVKINDIVIINSHKMDNCFINAALHQLAGKRLSVSKTNPRFCTVKVSYRKEGFGEITYRWVHFSLLMRIKSSINPGDFVVPRTSPNSFLHGRIEYYDPLLVKDVTRNAGGDLILVATKNSGDVWLEARHVKVVSNTTEEKSPDTEVKSNRLIDVTRFFEVAASVKRRSKEQVALHLAAEAGEIAECLIQPERKGNLVEESVDAILCALDLVYLELGKTHGDHEITEILNKTIAEKLTKWHNTCK